MRDGAIPEGRDLSVELVQGLLVGHEDGPGRGAVVLDAVVVPGRGARPGASASESFGDDFSQAF